MPITENQNWFSKLPIKTKMLVIIMAPTTICLLLAGITLVNYDLILIKQTMVQELSILATVIANRSTAALVFHDQDLAEKNLSALAAKQSMVLACIYTMDETVFASYVRPAYPRKKCPQPLPEYANYFQDSSLNLIQPIVLDGKQIGIIFLRSNLSVLETIKGQSILIGSIVILVTIAIAFFLAIKLQQVISGPLGHLATVAGTIRTEKDYSLRADSQGREDELGQLVTTFNGMLDTIEIQNRELLDARDHLEELVECRTEALTAANKELDTFAYSVSHDLRAPLRGIDGWSLALQEDYRDQLDTTAHEYLDRVRSETQRMGQLIDDMLQLSRVSRSNISIQRLDLSAIAQTVISRIQDLQPNRSVKFLIQPGLVAQGDPRLLEIVLTNLLDNANKFTTKQLAARVEMGCIESLEVNQPVFFVRDNGVGFDMTCAQQLFGAFQRMHKASEFPGTGIGLATVQRIIRRHGGRVWAESQVGQGATFYFIL
ncbi:Histidine kinase [Gammaproteobacteria bacterium]